MPQSPLRFCSSFAGGFTGPDCAKSPFIRISGRSTSGPARQVIFDNYNMNFWRFLNILSELGII